MENFRGKPVLGTKQDNRFFSSTNVVKNQQ